MSVVTGRCLCLQALRTASVEYELVPNQGAELPGLVDFNGRVVVIVSTTGGTAFDAALAQGAPAACFATTARIEGKTGWDVLGLGAKRALDLAEEHSADLSIIAASRTRRTTVWRLSSWLAASWRRVSCSARPVPPGSRTAHELTCGR